METKLHNDGTLESAMSAAMPTEHLRKRLTEPSGVWPTT